MFESFSHFLSYGASDQQTARMLTGAYDGLLVPGTVAAFQAEGTRGFVLTLSAFKQTRYVIDPRFPLFQQQLGSAKKSHEALALIMDTTLIRADAKPEATDFPPSRVESIAERWLRFNSGYTEVSSQHFAKYAERLGELVVPENRSGPEYVLPPYTVVRDLADPWWGVSRQLWEASWRHASSSDSTSRLVRVVATDKAASLRPLLDSCPDERIVVWVSALNELDTGAASRRSLVQYAQAIAAAAESGKTIFALYGGFFSVLLALYGLRGSSHGIGYGEARDWVELPQSGPPPARYYLPRAHRYVSQDLAAMLYRGSRSHQLAVCDCGECDGRSPAALDYQALMRHSVHCRSREIVDWTGVERDELVDRLTADSALFDEIIGDMDVPRALRRQADNCHVHLRMWAEVLQQV